MKRYTGQKALYEAISRSRAKAKQHSILEKLRPVLLKPETPAGQEPKPAAEPLPVVEQMSEPVVEESPQPEVAQTPSQQVVELPFQEASESVPSQEQISEMSASVTPVELVSSRPLERVIRPAPPSPVQTWRPRPVQFNEGRIEVSVPYYVGGIAGIVVLLVVLVAYRLGQAQPGTPDSSVGSPIETVVDRPGSAASSLTRTEQPTPASNTDRPKGNPPATATGQQDTTAPTSQGDNWIVLTRYQTRKDLEPVVEHFGRHGIDLFILPLDQAPALFAQYGLNAAKLPRGSGFLLVTVKAYDNPNVAGSEGNKMLTRIAEVGAQYKASNGLESFAPNYFSDAYGMKIR